MTSAPSSPPASWVLALRALPDHGKVVHGVLGARAHRLPRTQMARQDDELGQLLSFLGKSTAM